MSDVDDVRPILSQAVSENVINIDMAIQLTQLQKQQTRIYKEKTAVTSSSGTTLMSKADTHWTDSTTSVTNGKLTEQASSKFTQSFKKISTSPQQNFNNNSSTTANNHQSADLVMGKSSIDLKSSNLVLAGNNHHSGVGSATMQRFKTTITKLDGSTAAASAATKRQKSKQSVGGTRDSSTSASRFK